MLRIIKDTPLIEEIYEYDVILYSMGVNNSMSKGFNNDISVNFPKVKESECSYRYGDNRKYGTIHEFESDGIKFVSCYIKTPEKKRRKTDLFVSYEYLDLCLEKVSRIYKGKRIASKILGSDEFDGNGDREKIMKLFEKHFSGKGNDITIYDYIQEDYSETVYKKIRQAHYNYKHKLITTEDYLELRRVLEWRKRHGIFEEVPEDFKFTPKKKMKRKITFNKNGVVFL